jgi:RpiR family carbohydrate utilization transcriptional regulator
MTTSFEAPAPGPTVNSILSRIRELQSDLPPKANQIAALLLGQAGNVIHMSITEVAETCNVSEGTIVAFCRRVGARGFQEMKILLARDLIEPDTQLSLR